MNRHQLYTLIPTFLLAFSIQAQNLIPNSGFESYGFLPTSYGLWCGTTDWYNLNGECPSNATFGTPDYFHTMGQGVAQIPFSNGLAIVSPHAGEAVMAVVSWAESLADFREYLMATLEQPLEIGVSYHVSFHFCNGELGPSYGGYGTDNIGFRFSTDSLIQQGSEPLNIEPHLEVASVIYSNDWQQVSFDFVADSAYQYLTFGNFKDDASTVLEMFELANIETAYYYVDDFCVSKDFANCELSTTSIQELSSSARLTIYPNPATHFTQIFFDPHESGNYRFVLYNSIGQAIKIIDNLNAGESHLERGDLPTGCYFYQLEKDQIPMIQGKILFL